MQFEIRMQKAVKAGAALPEMSIDRASCLVVL